MAAFRGRDFPCLGPEKSPARSPFSPARGSWRACKYFGPQAFGKLAASWLYASLPCRQDRSKLRLRLRVASAAGPNGLKEHSIATARWPLRANIASQLLRFARGLTASRRGVAIQFPSPCSLDSFRRRLVGPSGQHRTSAAPLSSRAMRPACLRFAIPITPRSFAVMTHCGVTRLPPLVESITFQTSAPNSATPSAD